MHCDMIKIQDCVVTENSIDKFPLPMTVNPLIYRLSLLCSGTLAIYACRKTYLL